MNLNNRLKKAYEADQVFENANNLSAFLHNSIGSEDVEVQGNASAFKEVAAEQEEDEDIPKSLLEDKEMNYNEQE